MKSLTKEGSMDRMSPNQSQNTSTDASLNNTMRDIVGTDQNMGYRIEEVVGGDPLLTTDCPSYLDVMNKQIPRVKKFPETPFEDNEGSDASTPSQKITIESIKGHSDEDDVSDDDRSSVVTETSLSDDDHIEGTFHEGLKRSADTLAVEAINCASDELQCKNNNVIRVNSELVPGTSRLVGSTTGGVNNGYLMSEVGKPSRRRNDKRHGKELVISEQDEQVVSASSTTAPIPSTQQTTAIFNDSTDITLGNKTFITGSLTIKQYIKDANPTQPEPSFWQKLSRRRKIGAAVGLVSAILALIMLALLLTVLPNGGSRQRKVSDGDDGRKINPIDSTIDTDQTSSGSVLRMVSRGEWVAQPPNDDIVDLLLPTKRVIIAHTATENCTTQSSCVFRVRYIQNFHIESQNFSDIGYNFLVGGDGAVYEGRGWNKQGAHTKGYNVGSVCIAFIGTFTKLEPNSRQLNVAKLLLEEGVRLHKLHKDYKLFGHRQFYATESPGERLFRIIKTWDHWASDVNAS